MKLSLVSLFYALVACGGAAFVLMTFFKQLMPPADVRKFFGYWAVLVAIYFLSPNPLVFSILAVVFLLVVARNFDRLEAGAFFLILLPPGLFLFGDLPAVNYLLRINFAFLVAMILLTPVALKYFSRSPLKGLGSVDFAMVIVLLFILALTWRSTTFTDALRGTFVNGIKVLGIYYAFSRGVQSREHLKRVLTAFIAAAILAGAVGIVSSVINWDFFATQDTRLFDTFIRYKARAGRLRVAGLFGGAYADLGTTLMVALIAAAFAIAKIEKTMLRVAIVVGFIAAWFVTGSRGPIIALVAAMPVFILTRPNPMKSFFLLFAAGALGLLVFSFTGPGREFLAYLPFIGTEGVGEVTYRQRLMDASWEVIKRWPLFGNPDFDETPWMQQMRQGEGIIDVVNDYLRQAMTYGVPFALIYIWAHLRPVFANLSLARKVDDAKDREWRLIGGSLAAALMTYSLSYATTSKRSFADEIGWMLIGLNVAYARITIAERARRRTEEDAIPLPGGQVAYA
ncbi:O-antigen ligase family protein [Parvularcula lutaonensis]|uniref:O-antigen ligase family protein n=1 Tax=Parvularcula lutaonensis TaxID=491923 RepID=A0ABV7MF32_9PROT|nr:O-antigen ligase family protein [Parvularcula lutaonensis]GGY51245.1 hypothetical protein GCM10007148_20150 [Parvularcula lutaonensis]